MAHISILKQNKVTLGLTLPYTNFPKSFLIITLVTYERVQRTEKNYRNNERPHPYMKIYLD